MEPRWKFGENKLALLYRSYFRIRAQIVAKVTILVKESNSGNFEQERESGLAELRCAARFMNLAHLNSDARAAPRARS